MPGERLEIHIQETDPIPISRMISLALLLLALMLIAIPRAGRAQSAAVSFGTVEIGQTSSPSTVTVTFSSAGTIEKEVALATGAEKQDFAIVSAGHLRDGQSYQVSGSCTVSATFTAR